MATKKKKSTQPRRPKRQTNGQIRATLNGLHAGGKILVWFNPVDEWIIDGANFRTNNAYADEEWIESIVRGTPMELWAPSEDDTDEFNTEDGTYEGNEFYSENGEEFNLSLFSDAIFAIQVAQKGAPPDPRVSVPSLDHAIVFRERHMEIGCLEINKKDGLKIFKRMADWLGYELS